MQNSKLYFLVVSFFFLFFSCERTDKSIPKIELRIQSNITFDNIIRYYLLNLPPNYDSADNFALVIALHGGGGEASQMEKDYLLTEKADKEKFAILYPEGVRSTGVLGARTWNAGDCCDYAVEKNINDVGFISELISQILKSYPKINPKKVYVTGMSNGAMMAYRLACEIPEKIAAIAPVAGTMITNQACVPSRSVPILHIHSELDKKVPFEGGIGILGNNYPAVQPGLNQWIILNECDLNTKKIINFPNYTSTIWQNCSQNSMVEFILTKDGGHSWPGGLHNRAAADEPSTALNANDKIWEFFQQFQLP